jgi:dTDP-4-dehydrorhamnose reductase
MAKNEKILIIGVTGMLGHTLFAALSAQKNREVSATARSREGLSRWFSPALMNRIHPNTDADNFDSVLRVMADVKPAVVVNCVGIVKQLPAAKDPLVSIALNSLFPHRLALACKAVGARMIHISTDCVFSGAKGRYTEKDPSDADDLYGKTKFLGEVAYPHCVTLRTSIIGHELKGKYGLVEWFLSQEGKVQGYTHAVYSGFPTVEIARIISDYVVPNAGLHGLFQVSSEPITKMELLKLVAKQYARKIELVPCDDFRSDRSLDSSSFRKVTGYVPPAWPALIENMHRHWSENKTLYSRS